MPMKSNLPETLKQSIDLLTRYDLMVPEKVPEAVEFALDVNRRTRSFLGRKNTQTCASLFTLSMDSQSPFQFLRQCLAQIETKKLAVQEAVMKIKQAERRISRITSPDAEQALFILEQQNIVDNTNTYLLGALKDMADYGARIRQIQKNCGISPDWSEADMEAAEIDAHLSSAFYLCYTDVVQHGRIGKSAIDYFMALGVDPLQGFNDTSEFISSYQAGQSISCLHNWLTAMAVTYKDCYRVRMEFMGLDSIVIPEHQSE